MNINEKCVEAVNEMVGEGIEKHVQFISPEDNISFGLKEGGKIPKVTIEWVDASEADPENFEAPKTFEAVVKPVMEWMAKNKHPHMSIVIDSINAELLEGVEGVHTEEFLQD